MTASTLTSRDFAKNHQCIQLVQEVSIELTARMLATLFDFPYEDRRKLVHWSDLATNVPEVTGDDSIDMKERYDELLGAASAFYQLWVSKQGQPQPLI